MTKKHATYYTDADTRQSLIDTGMKAGAKEGRAASLGLRISAAYHERLVEALRKLSCAAANIEGENVIGVDALEEAETETDELLAEIGEAGK